MALSKIFASAASFFAISAHCARGIFQNATYEYIGGFSLASDICADAGKTKTVDSASRHSAAKTIQSFRFIIFISVLAQALGGGTLPWRRQCTPIGSAQFFAGTVPP